MRCTDCICTIVLLIASVCSSARLPAGACGLVVLCVV